MSESNKKQPSIPPSKQAKQSMKDIIAAKRGGNMNVKNASSLKSQPAQKAFNRRKVGR